MITTSSYSLLDAICNIYAHMNATKTETSTYRALCACIDLHIPVQIDTPMHPCKCLPFAPRSLSSQGDANAQARARALVDVHALAHAHAHALRLMLMLMR